MTDISIEELRERAEVLEKITKLEAEIVPFIGLVRERAQLLSIIERAEAEATNWTDLDELRERAQLLSIIDKVEGEDDWTDLDELRERVRLLQQLAGTIIVPKEE